MRFFVAALIGIFLGTLVSCATMPIFGTRLWPRYQGVDPKAAKFVNEWLSLAKERGIKFTDTVSIGFTDIPDENVIGQTNYGFGFNEIDLDKKYWNNSTNLSKLILVFHELGHAYCDRGHTYGKNIPYPENAEKRNEERFSMILNNKTLPGYYDDFCPKSVMYPEVLRDDCTTVHYGEYVVEMFNNCEPI